MTEVSIELNSSYLNIDVEHQQADENTTASTTWRQESHTIDPSSKTVSTPSDKYIQPKSLASTIPTLTTSTIYDVGNGGTSNDPPCSSYTVVNDPLRSIATSGIGGSCDNGPLFNTSIGGRWIRFIGTGGTTIPLTPPGIYHCGAFLAGWYNGTSSSIERRKWNSSILNSQR
ncbi:unnamed protein product [Rotaria sp. Silwood1]|nr:unnamed protein product [Rotaria sp. Silwood1]CAF1316649.1 unnamed protein product [Rotaria sp. Silwood1]CAF3501555.1 unnamed protein product [Rotaria sp. Silwood1]